MDSKKTLLALPGVFVPFNETVAILSYKHLRTLDYDIDVLTMKASKDQTIVENLKKDACYKKFNIFYSAEYTKAQFSHDYINIFKIIKNILQYTRKAIKMEKRKGYDVVYTSSLPNFSHLAGHFIKKKRKKNIKWIASFSDAIIKTPYQKFFIKENNRGIIYKGFHIIKKAVNENAYYQKIAFKNADLLIFVSEEQRDFMTKEKKELIEKSLIIPFTYIEEWPLYNNMIQQPYYKENKTQKIMMVHLGKIYGLRKIDSLVLGLALLKKEIADLDERIIIQQYGECDEKQAQLINENDVQNIFKIYDKISYEECLRKMQEADVLLLFDTIVDPSEIQPYLPSKIIEYLLANKLIYSICNVKSPIYRMLKETQHICVEPNAVQIKNTLKQIIKETYEIDNNFREFENAFVIENTLKKYL